jgi:sporulation protein YlmC with PRC-barrel domain
MTPLRPCASPQHFAGACLQNDGSLPDQSKAARAGYLALLGLRRTGPASPAVSADDGETGMTTTTSTHDVISSDRVEGTTVYNTAGEKLGTIDDLMIDKISGQVRYAVMEFGGFLGMGTDRYPIPWNMLEYDTSQEGYVVPLDKAKLEGAPRYADDSVPDYDDTYRGTVDKYYGL